MPIVSSALRAGGPVRRTAASCLLTVTVVLSVGDARAEPGAGERWYGAETLAVDVAAFTLIGGGALSSGRAQNGLLAGGVLVFVAGAPIVHAQHVRGGDPWTSFAARVLVPSGAFLLGLAVALGDHASGCGSLDSSGGALDQHCGEPDRTGAFGLAGVAMLGVSMVDAGVLAWDHRSGARVYASATPDGGAIGVRGAW